jgi:hypothetical protein
VYCFLNSRHALRERQRRRKFFNLERGMKREVKELFAKAERTKERLDEMMAELSDSLIKLLNSEISVEEHKAKSKAVQNAQKAWKQQNGCCPQDSVASSQGSRIQPGYGRRRGFQSNVFTNDVLCLFVSS